METKRSVAARFALAAGCIAGVAASALVPTAVDAQVTGRITANNGYAFGFGSATAVNAATARPWVWNPEACDISCCSGWETYAIDSATLSANEYAYILAAGDGDGRSSLTATFLNDADEVILNTTVAGGEWEACDMGAHSGTGEPTGGWASFVNGRIPSCTWVTLRAGWNGGNACSWSPTPEWVWANGVTFTSRRVLFRTRTMEITPPPCVDTVATGIDSGCSRLLPNCVGTGATARCVQCTTDAQCNDSNPCTIDTCGGFSICTRASVAAGAPGGCDRGFVCSGGATNVCVDCIDDTRDMTDSGCSSLEPHCRTTGTGAPTCEPCIDSGMATDIGCTTSAPNCVAGPSGSICASCVTNADCDDDNECTGELCSSGTCLLSIDPPGTPCTGGVCTGGRPFACVPCLDTATGAGLDAGCGARTPICLPTGDGVACQACADTGTGAVDDGCTDAAPACVTVDGVNRCAACLDSAEGSALDDGCTAEAPVCVIDGTGAPICVGCANDADCADPAPYCDVAAGTCVGCNDDTQCLADAPVCDPSTSACVGCASDDDCADFPETPSCDPRTGACGEAAEADAGVSDPDTGAGDLDAGAGELDAGAGELDAGTEEVDAGRGALAGGACACRAGTNAGLGGVWAGLAVLGALLARRRR